jgi:uncharacterized protein (DUF885 family)
MRNTTPALLLAACCCLAACASLSTTSASVESRVAAQNALFEDWYEYGLKAHPERATAYGDYRYNDRLDENSLASFKSEHASDEDFLQRLKAIRTSGFPEQDTLSHAVLVRTLEQRISNYGFKEYEMVLNQMDGPYVRLADLPLAVPFDSVKHYEDYRITGRRDNRAGMAHTAPFGWPARRTERGGGWCDGCKGTRISSPMSAHRPFRTAKS